MTDEVMCFRVSNKGQLLSIPVNSKTLDEASTRLPQGVYTTFRTFSRHTRVLGLNQHLQRLEYSARRSGYLGLLDIHNLRIAMRAALLQLGEDTEARLRISLDLTYEPGIFYLTIVPLQPLPQQVYEHGICLRSTVLHRPSPDVKATSFLVDSQSERQSMPEDVFELIMVDELGRILEGLTSNFFAVRSGIVYTAREGVLSGVTRQAVLDMAHTLGLRIVLEPFSLAAVDQLDEAFITSSSRGLVAAIQIDDCIVGTGKPGPIYKKLSKAYIGHVARTAEEI